MRVPRAVALRAFALRATQFTLVLLFLVAGAASLADAPAPGADFELLADLTGTGAWLHLLVGAAEVVGALLLAVRATTGLGAVLLGVLMTAAAAAYVAVLHAPPVVPAVLVAGLAALAYAHRASLAVAGKFLERNL